MPVGSPQRRPRATGGGAAADRAPPATEHAGDMRPRAHNLHIVGCRRQRPIGHRSAAAHRPLQPRPFSGEGSQGSVITEPISLHLERTSDARRCISGPPLCDGPNVTESACGPSAHPLQWSLRPPARSGPRVHPPESRGRFGRARSRCSQLQWLGRAASHQPARPISSPHERPIGISHHRRRRRKAGISSRPVQCHRSGGHLAGTAGRGAVTGP